MMSVRIFYTDFSPMVVTCGSTILYYKSVTMSLCSNKKGKAVPLQVWNGPEGSRKLRFPDFMTTAQDGGKVVSLTHRPPLYKDI
jgi:hypothetical protein